MSVLVLSATGTTGSQTLRALVRRGADVRAASRDPQKANFGPGVQAVAFSLDDRRTWAAALQGVTALYLCFPPFRTDEVELGKALVDAAKAAGVQKIVKLSAMGVEYAPESGHRQVELYIEGSGLKWIHLRPSFFHENFINFYGATVKGDSAIYLPAGKGRTPFVAAEDIGEAAAAALLGDASGEAWTLTGPELLDHDQVAATLSAASGKNIRYVDVPREAHIEGMKSWGMPELAIQTMSGLYDMVRADAVAQLSGEVQRVLGRAPKTFAAWAAENARAWD